MDKSHNDPTRVEPAVPRRLAGFARLGAVTMAFALILGACSSGGGTAAPGGSSAAPTTAASGSAGAESEAPSGSAGESPSGSAGGSAGTGAGGECPDTAQGQSIEMWSPLTGPDGDEMTALAETFSGENEQGITVSHVAQPEYIQKLEASAAAQQLPAMTVVRVINVGQLAARNVVKPFSDEVLGILGDDIASDFPEQVWTRGEYNGERYSVPLDMHPLVMYYNKEMFSAAGVEEPGTEPMSREDFEAALTALEANGQPIAIGTGFQAATLFQTFIEQFGGSLTNEDGTQVTYNSEQGVEALEYVKQLKDQYSPDISGPNDPEAGVFKQGQAAILIHGPWHISDLSQLDFVGFAPVPQVGDEYAVWGGSHQLALTTDDPAAQAAAGCWIAWLTENSVQWAAAGQVPARTSARESGDLESSAPAIAAIAEAAAETTIILPQVPLLEGSLWDEFGPVVDGFLAGDVTDAGAALNEAAGRSQQKIDENAQNFGS